MVFTKLSRKTLESKVSKLEAKVVILEADKAYLRAKIEELENRILAIESTDNKKESDDIDSSSMLGLWISSQR